MPKTVLLADDSIAIQRVVELTFADQDVNVVAVGDGDRAIDTLRHEAPDLVLADIGMPGRTGYDVAEFIRSQPRLANVPVLLLAGAFEPIDQAQARRVGADGILTKPLEPAVLVGRVTELLNRGRIAGDTPHVEGAAAGAAAPSALSAAAPDEVREPHHVDAERAAPNVGAHQWPAPQDAPRSDSDRYFDEIDQAFATLSRLPRSPLPVQPEEPPPAESGPSTPVPVAPPPAAVPLTDAFAALLDAERSGAGDARPVAGPSPPPRPLAAAAPALDVDALADQIARRVLAQLTDRVVRDAVSDVVSTTAERLVREEIERIKRNIT